MEENSINMIRINVNKLYSIDIFIILYRCSRFEGFSYTDCDSLYPKFSVGVTEKGLSLTLWPLTSDPPPPLPPVHQLLQEINSMIRTGESPSSRKRSMALEDEVSAKRVCADNHSALLRRLQDVANDRSSSRWPHFLEEKELRQFLPECILQLFLLMLLFLLTWSFWSRLTNSSLFTHFSTFTRPLRYI